MSQAIQAHSTNVVQFQPKVPAVAGEIEVEASADDVQRLLVAVILRTMSAKHRKRADVLLSVAEQTDNLTHRAVAKRARRILDIN